MVAHQCFQKGYGPVERPSFSTARIFVVESSDFFRQSVYVVSDSPPRNVRLLSFMIDISMWQPVWSNSCFDAALARRLGRASLPDFFPIFGVIPPDKPLPFLRFLCINLSSQEPSTGRLLSRFHATNARSWSRFFDFRSADNIACTVRLFQGRLGALRPPRTVRTWVSVASPSPDRRVPPLRIALGFFLVVVV